MENNSTLLIALLLMGGVSVFVWWRSRQSNVATVGAIENTLTALAARHQWESKKTGNRQTPIALMGSTEGNAWQLDYFTRSSMTDSSLDRFSEAAPYLVWRMPSVTLPNAEFVVIQAQPGTIGNFHRAAKTPLVGNVSIKNALWFAAQMMNTRLTGNSKFWAAGSDEVGLPFAIFTSDETTAGKLVNSKTKTLLSAYASRYGDKALLMAAVHAGGFWLLVQPLSSAIDDAFVEEFVQLGTDLAQALRV